MSSLRAFRFQKSRPASSSPGSVVSETTASPASEKTSVSSQNGENGGNSQKIEEDSEDIIRPPVRILLTVLPILPQSIYSD